MFRLRPRSSLLSYSFGTTATRSFHRVTTEFSSYDTQGNLITRGVPIIIGDPGEAYVLVDPEIGRALYAARQHPVASIEDRCKLTFFHDSHHFGVDSFSYPRLYVPRNTLPRQSESDYSPATLFMTGKMHQITLDGTFDALFAEYSTASARNLSVVLDQLKDM